MPEASAGAPGVLSGGLRRHFERLRPEWRAALSPVLASAAVDALIRYVDGRVAAGHRVYPPQPLAALQDCAPAAVRAVVLGQDPYHGAGQAHGYAFSVPEGVPLPPSLRNIFAERERDCGCPRASAGGLLGWSRQGVLLLNTVLTVEEGRPGSHAGHGWEAVTDAVIDALTAQAGAKAFLLWGAQAQAKGQRIAAAGAHALVLCANHPSPLSARRGPAPFLGCGHFSAANRYLAQNGRDPIDWCR
jgi:uracil-DNA glycosylase